MKRPKPVVRTGCIHGVPIHLTCRRCHDEVKAIVHRYRNPELALQGEQFGASVL